MPRKKQPNNVVKLDLVKTKIQPEFDFSFIFDGDDFWFNGFGLRNGQELQFKYVEEFFDGDFVALCIKSSYFFGFGYSLNNSILLGMNSYTPYPRKDIESIGKLVSAIKLNRYKDYPQE